MAFLGRHYKIPLNGLATGVADNTYILEFRAATDKPCKVSYIQGHYENPATSDQLSMGLINASAATAGSALTPEKANPDDPAAGFTASTSAALAGVTPVGIAFAHFGGLAASGFQWYAPNDGPGNVLKPSDIVVLVVRIAPGTSRLLRGEIGIEEL